MGFSLECSFISPLLTLDETLDAPFHIPASSQICWLSAKYKFYRHKDEQDTVLVFYKKKSSMDLLDFMWNVCTTCICVYVYIWRCNTEYESVQARVLLDTLLSKAYLDVMAHVATRSLTQEDHKFKANLSDSTKLVSKIFFFKKGQA